MSSAKGENSTYLSPRPSPALGFVGSPALSQSSSTWAPSSQGRGSPYRSIPQPTPTSEPLGMGRHYSTCSSIPSPPEHGSSFSSTPSIYHGRNAPLTPPASDGLMSPPNHPQDSLDAPVWLSDPYDMHKPTDGGLSIHISHSGAPSPPPLCIEDILKEPQHMGGFHHSYLDDHAYGIPQMSSIKRRKTPTGFTSPPPPPPPPTSYMHTQPPQTESPPRTRKKRQMTDPSEANFQCDKCGKYFSRIWNYNAHLETHDPERARPHVCPVPECKKSFVRRTDLTRHTQCVHAKDKKFQCQLCNNMFARKDTLRRHEDDGCPKRVDIVSKNAKHKPFQCQSQTLSFLSSVAGRTPEQDSYYYEPQHLRSQQFTDPALTQSGLPPLSDIMPQNRSW